VIVLPITVGCRPTSDGALFRGSIALFTVASFMCGNAGSLGSLISGASSKGWAARVALYIAGHPVRRVSARRVRHRDGDLRRRRHGRRRWATVGGWITDMYGWPWIFYINIRSACWRWR